MLFAVAQHTVQCPDAGRNEVVRLEKVEIVMIDAEIDIFATFLAKLGRTIAPADLKSLEAAAQEPAVRAAVLKELGRAGKKAKFNSYEHVKAVRLLVEPFTIDNELLTPTLKLKRPQTARKYRGLLDEMYEEVRAAAPVARAKL